ncbi:hypothetical protein PAXINDRAFT_102857 [Paxillus involutus ATCC 200175]|uniref:SAP domain-containing protein n=1 Tax=Paxillus involutus ATCC 200175 TaxID=664439 RepID=A0A0C9TK53_PAXIN|nr:hypothetical protein PAXINDRAFT_102857 [Paxillus involutus ATCC 200175]
MSGPNTSDSEVILLPCLAQEYEPGKQLKTEEFVVTQKTTKLDLRSRLEQYKLPFSGSKAMLLQRLRDYSKDQNAWLSLFQPWTKRARGVHTGRESHSTKRIREQFGTEESNRKIMYQSRKSVARVQRVLEDQDRESNNGWSKAVLAAFNIGKDLNPGPRTSKRPRLEQEEPTRSVVVPPSACSTTIGSDSADATLSHEKDNLSVRMRRMEHKIFTTNENLIQRVDSFEASIAAQMRDIKDLIGSTCAQIKPMPSPTLARTLTAEPHGFPQSPHNSQSLK